VSKIGRDLTRRLRIAYSRFEMQQHIVALRPGALNAENEWREGQLQVAMQR